MKPLILVVEDNQDLLYNLKLTLEFNEYDVLIATNGEDAIKILTDQKTNPDLIISDIMMPEMDGYDFFKKVSENPLWSRIPFIFLTALSSPKDIRLGKMLGVDDYIVKPFKEEDLIASVAGKLARSQKNQSINLKIEQLFKSLEINKTPVTEDMRTSVFLLIMGWNDKLGPIIQKYYPKDAKFPVSIETVGFQLFNGATSIYGQAKIHQAQGFLLNVSNINRQAYIYFDSIPDKTARAGQRPFMVGAIAPRINYFESLKIKMLFAELSQKIKKEFQWDLVDYWERTSEILLSPII